MKLYTRLINEGVFIFWNPDEGNTSYSLKIKIAVGDDKVELVNLETRKGENYYSFSGIGSGDYEIELNGFKDNRLYQTETKKIKIVYTFGCSAQCAVLHRAKASLYTREPFLIRYTTERTDLRS